MCCLGSKSPLYVNWLLIVGISKSWWTWGFFSCNKPLKLRLTSGADHREKKYKAHRQFGDRRGGVISARTYFYADEAKCDMQMETFINCIKASGK